MSTVTTTEIESPLSRLSSEQIDALGSEFDAIRDRVRADLGERDRRYIESMIAMHRRLGVISRALLLASNNLPARAAGTVALGAAKILENMEIGHNVLHGQWDWMNDPHINSSTWDWDTASTAEAWKHSHNYVHHTFTNIRGKDKDLGYEIMRIDPQQPWHPVYLLQPFYNLILMALFEWGVATHDLDFEAIRTGEKSKAEVKRQVGGIVEKAKSQIVKDYIAWPLLSGLATVGVELALESVADRREPGRRRRRGGLAGSLRRALDKGARAAGSTAKANATANVARNVWAYAIIFCGHFPDQTYTFSEAEVEDESPGGWYVRQLSGSANIEGGPFFHVASGNLGFQVEHHLFPDLPSTRYAEIAPQVKDVCERYGLPYNSGPLLQQLGMVQRTILRLALPGGKPRPKPGPYRGERVASL
ncbi:MAG TPA: acyl-CoA desaturase [Solirubrobacterales bacterium]|jgi:linoleoyl-CoA desaturase|nr:acyl-CoA desaturase [Solirubrobacterales bacterium]